MSQLFDSLRRRREPAPASPTSARRTAHGDAVLATLGYTPVRHRARVRLAAPLALVAGVAVAAFLTAAQTFVQQRNTDVIREVYSWILGRLGTAGWQEVLLLLPYAGVGITVVLLHRRLLDALAVGEEEARTLGVRPERVRIIVVLAATLATAGAVAVSGLIGFVGIIVPHAVRLLVGGSYRVILPLSVLGGGAFMVVADLVARSVLSPAEVPIGVVTAFIGGPFFLLVLRTSTRGGER